MDKVSLTIIIGMIIAASAQAPRRLAEEEERVYTLRELNAPFRLGPGQWIDFHCENESTGSRMTPVQRKVEFRIRTDPLPAHIIPFPQRFAAYCVEDLDLTEETLGLLAGQAVGLFTDSPLTSAVFVDYPTSPETREQFWDHREVRPREFADGPQTAEAVISNIFRDPDTGRTSAVELNILLWASGESFRSRLQPQSYRLEITKSRGILQLSPLLLQSLLRKVTGFEPDRVKIKEVADRISGRQEKLEETYDFGVVDPDHHDQMIDQAVRGGRSFDLPESSPENNPDAFLIRYKIPIQPQIKI